MLTTDLVASRLAERLSEAHFRVRTGEQLGAQPIRFVASRTKFIVAGMALMSTHIVVLEKDEAKPRDMDDLSSKAVKLAKHINRIPLPRGVQFGYGVIPLIVGRNPDSELLLYAASAPTARWGLFEFPVVIDLTREQAAYFEGTKKWGQLLWLILQDIVAQHIEPVVEGDR